LPIANTWTEELVAEWLHLDGFLVEIGLPAAVPARGGRREADVVGARMTNGRLEVCHCEVAEWIVGGKVAKSVAKYRDKFSKEVCTIVGSYFCRIFGAKRVSSYRKLVISKTYPAEFPKLMKKSLPNFEAILFERFVQDYLVTSIEKWKKKNLTRKGTQPELPRAIWLLKMVEFLSEWSILSK
jgi:hypothetical protein